MFSRGALISFLTISTFAMAVSGCVESTVVERTEIVSPDFRLLAAEIEGMRVGISPRMVQRQISKLGYEETKFNRLTLRDAISKYDRGVLDRAQIIFSLGERTILFSDDKTLIINFCMGEVSEISIRETIFLKDFEHRKSKDINMFPEAISKPPSNKRVMYSAEYKPKAFSRAFISYVNRGYSDFASKMPVINRSVSVYEGITCLKKELGHITPSEWRQLNR